MKIKYILDKDIHSVIFGDINPFIVIGFSLYRKPDAEYVCKNSEPDRNDIFLGKVCTDDGWKIHVELELPNNTPIIKGFPVYICFNTETHAIEMVHTTSLKKRDGYIVIGTLLDIDYGNNDKTQTTNDIEPVDNKNITASMPTDNFSTISGMSNGISPAPAEKENQTGSLSKIHDSLKTVLALAAVMAELKNSAKTDQSPLEHLKVKYLLPVNSAKHFHGAHVKLTSLKQIDARDSLVFYNKQTGEFEIVPKHMHIDSSPGLKDCFYIGETDYSGDVGTYVSVTIGGYRIPNDVKSVGVLLNHKEKRMSLVYDPQDKCFSDGDVYVGSVFSVTLHNKSLLYTPADPSYGVQWLSASKTYKTGCLFRDLLEASKPKETPEQERVRKFTTEHRRIHWEQVKYDLVKMLDTLAVGENDKFRKHDYEQIVGNFIHTTEDYYLN